MGSDVDSVGLGVVVEPVVGAVVDVVSEVEVVDIVVVVVGSEQHSSSVHSSSGVQIFPVAGSILSAQTDAPS